MKSGRFARPLLGLATLLIWALAAGSVLFWALRLGGAGAPSDTPPAGGGTGGVAVDAQALARALGAVTTASATPAPDLLGRLALRGLLTHDGRGAALISVDGKPAAEWVAQALKRLEAMPEVRVLRRTTANGFHDHHYVSLVERRAGALPPVIGTITSMLCTAPGARRRRHTSAADASPVGSAATRVVDGSRPAASPRANSTRSG